MAGSSESGSRRPEPDGFSGRVAIIGGTGRLGLGLARRLQAAAVDIVLGSRDPARAETAARSMGLAAQAGRGNVAAAEAAEVIVITVPSEAHTQILSAIAEATAGKVVVDTTVSFTESALRFHSGRPERSRTGAAVSAAEEASRLLPRARVVAGFHTVSAPMLADLARPPHGDVLLCGDDEGAKESVAHLVRAIRMRPVDAGPLAHARILEQLPRVLVTINKRYRRRDLGIQIAGLD